MMTREEILAKSRQENKDQDLYELSVGSNAGRIGLIAMYAAAVILSLVSIIRTGYFDLSVWLVAMTGEAAMKIYKAVKLKTPKAIIYAAVSILIDVVIAVLIFMGVL